MSFNFRQANRGFVPINTPAVSIVAGGTDEQQPFIQSDPALSARQQLANALIAPAISGGPIYSPLQLIAQLGSAGLGGYMSGKVGEEAATKQEELTKKMASALRAGEAISPAGPEGMQGPGGPERFGLPLDASAPADPKRAMDALENDPMTRGIGTKLRMQQLMSAFKQGDALALDRQKKIGETRKIERGDKTITQEFDGNAWRDLEEAPRWQGNKPGDLRSFVRDNLKVTEEWDAASGTWKQKAAGRLDNSGDYAPTQIAKLIKERDALPPNHPDRAAYDAAIKKVESYGEMSPAQKARMDAQQKARESALRAQAETMIENRLKTAEKDNRFVSPQSRAAARAAIAAEVYGDLGVPPAQAMAAPQGLPAPTETTEPPALPQSAPPERLPVSPIASPGQPAPMPQPRPQGAPMMPPGRVQGGSGAVAPEGMVLRLPAPEEKQQRDVIANTGMAIERIDGVLGRLGTERGVSTTTGMAGAAQRGYNSTLGQVFGNASERDAETMSQMAALKPMLQQALKVDSNMSAAERKDLERILEGWGAFTSRDTIMTNLKTVRDVLTRRRAIAEGRLGGEQSQMPDRPVRLKFDRQGNPVMQ